MPKDKWIAQEAEVLIAPPLPFSIEEAAAARFSGVVQEPPTPNPEIEGCQIVLIAQNNSKVQRPPQYLDRMHASLQKQVAFNGRVLKNEEEISGINSELAQFVLGLSSDPSIPIYICVNDAPSMCGSQPIGGQYWKQGELQLASTNMVYFDADNSKKSVAISALCDAVAWRRALEIVSDEILQGCDSNTDFEGNRQKLYEEIAKECATFAHPPVFLCENDPATKQWPGLSENVAEWMHKAEQIAIGSFRQVLENGPDVSNSESDSENSDHGEELEDIYTPEMLDNEGKPKSGPIKLTPQEAAWQRALAKRQKSQAQFLSSTSDVPEYYETS
jgi:hypothetical protein